MSTVLTLRAKKATITTLVQTALLGTLCIAVPNVNAQEIEKRQRHKTTKNTMKKWMY